MASRYKPCPICGNDRPFELDVIPAWQKHAAMCGECGWRTPEFPTREESIADWNRRAEREGEPQ